MVLGTNLPWTSRSGLPDRSVSFASAPLDGQSDAGKLGLVLCRGRRGSYLVVPSRGIGAYRHSPIESVVHF